MIENVYEFAAQVLECLPFEPTAQQIELVAALSRYCGVETPSDTVFVLNGYAGTGKTSVTGALVRALKGVGIRSVLLAPTGRAAKVLAGHAGHPAWTIHRRIYRHSGGVGMPGGGAGGGWAAVAENKAVNTVFIVDEASMIQAEGGGEGRNVLEDLVHYVFSGTNCRLILSGDTAQLPPPGSEESPAMSADVLRGMGLRVMRAVMTKTVRQGRRSGILYNATRLRRGMYELPTPVPEIVASPFGDVWVCEGEELQDKLEAAYARHGVEGTLLITRSNRRAVGFNLAIRSEILDYDTELVRGEPLMVSKNNYYWTRGVKGVDFIANGDIGVVERIYGTESVGGVRFADVALRLADHDVTLDVKILLSSLVSEAPGLDAGLQKRHLEACLGNEAAWAAGTPVERRYAGLKDDAWFNALQVKYAYSVTCHKAQGGQWASVFVDMGAIQPEALVSMDFYRWMYTATTRAVEEVTYVAPGVRVR